MSVTRNETEHAASMVKAIAKGLWTDDLPTWADSLTDDCEVTCSMRAVLTAEAFILFFSAFNPRFDQDRFLIACGLKKGKP